MIALACLLCGRAGAATPLPPATPPSASWTPQAVALADRALADVRARGLTGDAAIAHAVRFLADDASQHALGVRVAVGTVGGRNRSIVDVDATSPTDPASNAKLATTLHVLDTLGPRHVFETPFRTDGSGALYVEGTFDPTITVDHLRRIARALRRKGTTQLGDVVLDGSRLAGDPVPAGYAKFGRQRWEYLARPAALSVDKTRFRVALSPGAAAGDRARYATANNDPVANGVVTVPAGTPFKLGLRVEGHRDGRPLVRLRGTIAADSRARELVMRAPDALRAFEDELRDAFQAEGVTITGASRRGPAPAGATTLYTLRSRPLARILEDSVAGSNAFDNEVLALAAASARRGGAPVTVADGVRDLARFLRAKAHLPGAHVANASGIGAQSRFTTREILAMLRYAARHEHTRPLFDALAVAGQAGTLKGRMVGTPAEGLLRAKTGTDGPNVALSGVIARGGRKAPLGFSAIASGPRARRTEARAWLDALGITLAQLEPRAPRGAPAVRASARPTARR